MLCIRNTPSFVAFLPPVPLSPFAFRHTYHHCIIAGSQVTLVLKLHSYSSRIMTIWPRHHTKKHICIYKRNSLHQDAASAECRLKRPCEMTIGEVEKAVPIGTAS